MENSGFSALWTVLGIIAVPAVIALIAYGAMVWLRKQARLLARQIDTQLLDFTQRHDQLRGFLLNYRGIDSEPFFTHLDTLQNEARIIDNRLSEHLEDFRQFVERLDQSQERSTPQHQLLEPVNQFRHWHQARKLKREGTEIAAQVAEAEKRVQTIYELPWDLALECRKADEQNAELDQHIRWLQENNARGVSLQKVASQVQFLQQGMLKIPDIFFDAGKEELLKSVKLESAIKAFETLGTIRPALDRYLPQVREWRANLEKVSGEYRELKSTGARLRQTMANPPAGLLVTSLQTRLDQVAQRAAEIQQQINQPDADNLKTLAREVHLLRQTLHATEEQYNTAVTQLAELQAAITDIQGVLQIAVTQREALERRETFPLAWDASSPALDALRSEIEALGTVRQQRTPEQILQQRKSVEDLRSRLKALAAATPQIAALHQSLVQLLDSSDLQEGSAWLRKTRALLDKTAQYDPKNWSKSDSLANLPVDVEELTRAHDRLVPANRAVSLKESALETRLKETQALAQQHKAIRTRAASVEARFERLQALEAESKERLDAAWNMIERVTILTENNDLLDELAGKEISGLEDELRQAVNDLNAHGQGDIEKKAARIQTFAEKVRAALNTWLSQLNTALMEQHHQIDTKLSEVEAVVRLEDRSVDDARSFLTQMQGELPSQRTAPPSPQSVVSKVASRFQHNEPKSAQTDLEVLADIKRKNDLWVNLLGFQAALEEKIEPVLSAYKEAIQARDEARELLAEAQKRFPVQRAWPPSNQPALTESAIFGAQDERWGALRQRRVQPAWAVNELQQIAQQYQVAMERIRKTLERVDEDQERIQDQEWQIEVLKQRWLSQSDPSKPVLREGVKSLISDIEARLSDIRQKYLSGSLSYEEALKSLRFLYDEVVSKEIMVDEHTKVGLKDTHRRVERA